jgi:hypothetical protein
MHSWDQMKPRTVYEKAVQDFTDTAQRLARLNQHFRQASFAEFEMLMVDDEVLKRYELPSRWSSGRSSKCIKLSCSISSDDGFSKTMMASTNKSLARTNKS